jgi:hypothetical protein
MVVTVEQRHHSELCADHRQAGSSLSLELGKVGRQADHSHENAIAVGQYERVALMASTDLLV